MVLHSPLSVYIAVASRFRDSVAKKRGVVEAVTTLVKAALSQTSIATKSQTYPAPSLHTRVVHGEQAGCG